MMIHTYEITGMTCYSCETNISNALSDIKGITEVTVSKDSQSALLTMQSHINLDTLQKAIGYKYTIIPIKNREISLPQKSTNVYTWTDTMIWKRASFNTLNCLVGCSIGDFGMILFLQYFYPDTSMAIQMLLAIIAGLITSITLETAILHVREKLHWKNAFKMAIGMSFLSMIAMEIAMNVTDFMITGGQLTLTDPNYWLAFIPAAMMGFLVPLPYNYYQLKKYNKACH